MANEFIKSTKIKPAIIGTIADPDQYNQNIGGQSTGAIVCIDDDGEFVDGDIGDEGLNSTGALVNNLKIRQGGNIKIYDSFGVFVKNITYEQATEILEGTAKIATSALAKALSNDTDFITALKLSDAIKQIAIFEDQKSSGTVGGTGTIGATQTRTLNTTVINNISGASLSSNQITLPAGTYYVEGWSAGYATANTKAFLYNVSNSTYSLIGTNNYALATGSYANSFVSGIITIASSKVFDLRLYTQITDGGSSSLGKPSSTGQVEVYSRVSIKKLA